MFERGEQAVRVEPARGSRLEALELGALLCARIGLEPLVGVAQPSVFEADRLLISGCLGFSELLGGLELGLREKSMLC